MYVILLAPLLERNMQLASQAMAEQDRVSARIAPSPAPLRKFRGLPRLSFLGAAALGFTLYLFLFPVAKNQDILAGILAFCLSFFLLFLLISAAILQQMLRKKMQITSRLLAEGGTLHAQSHLSRELLLFGCRLPALFHLELFPRFKQKGVQGREISFSGLMKQKSDSPGNYSVNAPVLFPHRGDWEDLGYHIRLSDHFGLCEASWHYPPKNLSLLSIDPALYAVPELPLLASFENPGDIQISQTEPLGDAYDLKAYHPSDGARKIHWKVYARRRELVSRHPERTMSPEGLALLFCFTDREDDSVCRVAEKFISQLRDEDLHFFLGTEGMHGRNLAETKEDARSLFLASVWNCPGKDDGIQDLQDTLSKASIVLGRQAQSICIFLSEKRLLRSKNFTAQIQKALRILQENSCRTQVFFIQDLSESSQGGARLNGFPMENFLFRRAHATSTPLHYENSQAFTRTLSQMGIACEYVELRKQGETP